MYDSIARFDVDHDFVHVDKTMNLWNISQAYSLTKDDAHVRVAVQMARPWTHELYNTNFKCGQAPSLAHDSQSLFICY